MLRSLVSRIAGSNVSGTMNPPAVVVDEHADRRVGPGAGGVLTSPHFLRVDALELAARVLADPAVQGDVSGHRPTLAQVAT
jgi:hypothetical protein